MEIKLSSAEEEAFQQIIGELTADPRCEAMRRTIQHGTVTTYDHCMSVAREAFRLNRNLHIRADERQLVTAAFLHDYFLYDWHTKGDHLHGFHHPKIAAENARRDFGISKKEQAIISSHMWPLTFFHVPCSREAWILAIADKICSTEETLLERT